MHAARPPPHRATERDQAKTADAFNGTTAFRRQGKPALSGMAAALRGFNEQSLLCEPLQA